jgi:dolichol-phosphate mannosyltransferase
MLERARAGHDLVIASRFRPGAEWHGKTWDRVLFSYGVSWLFRILFPIGGVRDYTCGYRLYRRELLQAAYDRWGDGFLAEGSFACMLDILLKVSRLKPRVTEVPLVLHYDRKPGPSKMQVARMVRRTLVLLVRRRLGIFD